MSELIITLDGPSGAGKGTVAELLSQRLLLPVLNSGALYRIAGLLAHEQNIAPDDTAALIHLCEQLSSELHLQWTATTGTQFIIGGRVLNDAIRGEDAGAYASIYGAVPEVRKGLLELQRRLLPNGGIAEGRDMGTVVFPESPYKFFLTAAAEQRAMRRYTQLHGRMPLRQERDFLSLLAQIVERDKRDSERAASPLRAAPDAVVVDSTLLTIEQVVETICSHLPS